MAAALGKTTETDGQGQTSQLTAKAVRTVKSKEDLAIFITYHLNLFLHLVLT